MLMLNAYANLVNIFAKKSQNSDVQLTLSPKNLCFSSACWQNTQMSKWLCHTDRSFLLFPSNNWKLSPRKFFKTELFFSFIREMDVAFVQAARCYEGLWVQVFSTNVRKSVIRRCSQLPPWPLISAAHVFHRYTLQEELWGGGAWMR